MTGVLAFDVGRTACRAVRVLAAATPGVGPLLGAPVVVQAGPSIAEPGGLDAVLTALATAAGQLEPHGEPVVTVCVGLAGLGDDPSLRQALADRVALAHPHANVLVTGDVVTAHAGALAGGPGVVLAAGTGAVALGVTTSDGDAERAGGPGPCSVRVDGWGWMVGDDGSGFAIGRAGLAAALRAYDGRGPATRLLDLAEERFGEIGGLALLLHRQDRPVAVVASFATSVSTAADGGDPTACAIRDDAARALATTAAAAVNRLVAVGAPMPVPVAWTGGLTRDMALFGASFHTTLCTLAPAAKPVEAAGEPLDGAARLAAGAAGLHAHLLHSRPASAPTDQPRPTPQKESNDE